MISFCINESPIEVQKINWQLREYCLKHYDIPMFHNVVTSRYYKRDPKLESLINKRNSIIDYCKHNKYITIKDYFEKIKNKLNSNEYKEIFENTIKSKVSVVYSNLAMSDINIFNITYNNVRLFKGRYPSMSIQLDLICESKINNITEKYLLKDIEFIYNISVLNSPVLDSIIPSHIDVISKHDKRYDKPKDIILFEKLDIEHLEFQVRSKQIFKFDSRTCLIYSTKLENSVLSDRICEIKKEDYINSKNNKHIHLWHTREIFAWLIINGKETYCKIVSKINATFIEGQEIDQDTLSKIIITKL